MHNLKYTMLIIIFYSSSMIFSYRFKIQDSVLNCYINKVNWNLSWGAYRNKDKKNTHSEYMKEYDTYKSIKSNPFKKQNNTSLNQC